MVQIVKKEWHQVTSSYKLEIDETLLSEIYPDMSEKELVKFLEAIQNGDVVIDDVISDARDNDVDLEWDHDYDDWWTDRKGGYEVTYDVGE